MGFGLVEPQSCGFCGRRAAAIRRRHESAIVKRFIVDSL
jgi:hypothetical protein